jgi:hypothetical protein
MLIRAIFNAIHSHKIYIYEIYTYKSHAKAIHAHKIYAYGIHTHKSYAYAIYARKMYARDRRVKYKYGFYRRTS